MAKKFTSLVLALIMCLSLCVPTLALNNQQNGDDLEVVDSLGNKTIATLGALGIPVVGGKIVDHFTKEVYYTNFKVATRVYFDGKIV